MTMKCKALLLYKILLTVCVLVLAACFAIDAMAEALTVRIVQASGGLNVRTGPGAEYKPVYLLDNCETVIVVREQDGWALVTKNHSRGVELGWVCEEYLK